MNIRSAETSVPAPSPTDHRSDRWSGELLDLDAYLARIGYDGPREPTLAVLRNLQRAHTTGIPFENVHAVLGRDLPLDLPSVEARLVRDRRGGYCFEHVLLFAAVLERLGFHVTGMIGRVSLGAPKVLPATHGLLAVAARDDDREWLCDVGFGAGPLGPIELADGAQVAYDGWRHRLERHPGAHGIDQWWLYQTAPGTAPAPSGPDGGPARGSAPWIDRHTFTLTAQYPIDYVVGSHFVGTHARSPFVRRLFVQRMTPAAHHSLDDLTLVTTLPDGTSTSEEIAADALDGTLRAVFGLALTQEELREIAARRAAPEREA
ncbi:arylamine N-acetyltransferase family protein [Streptomyces sp. NRRL F-2664]|uniref:arylamine N-acetyltransferase family protein n=1 Tax=Streptomyces sp. NRRL F-2664 TaxID=1463842 RepID=UPI0004CAF59C|nr:arylamine N-acetyltransferase [Streptomyces sp. NRRL F-2664]